MQTVKKLRHTKETEIEITFNPEGSGNYKINTPIKFFNHMLELFCAHSMTDLCIDAKSLDCDPHHLVEDCAITLGSAIRESLGDKSGINRYASVILPMDEALIMCAVDISGRAYLKCDIQIKEEKTADFETVLLAHFFASLTQSAGITLHLKMLEGQDPHHIIECTFKAFAHAIRQAISKDLKNQNKIPSTKGVL